MPISNMPLTLAELLCDRAAQRPDNPAYTFLIDGAHNEATLTYAQVETRARAIASWLSSIARPGDRVLLLYPPGPQFVTAFFGCICAGAIPVSAYPLDPSRPNRPLTRLKAIIGDCDPVLGLTTSASLDLIRSLSSDDSARLNAICWMTVDHVPTFCPSSWHPPECDPDGVAALQYTSGSTADPRGVILTHANILSIEDKIQRTYGYSSETTFVGWVPLAHDWGLIYFVLQSLYVGARSVIMTPAHFIERPMRWLEAISKYQNVMSAGPNFSYQMCVRKRVLTEPTALDLSEWRWALIGAEPTRPQTLADFVETFGPSGFRRTSFYSAYGLAEATLTVSASSVLQEPRIISVSKDALEQNRVTVVHHVGARIVSCGVPLIGETVLIVDPVTLTTLPECAIGEIWVSGTNVARGYWNKPDQTIAIFGAYTTDTLRGPFLRTGDLGFTYQGELFITGRLKDIIIIRGRNIYPQDVEYTAEQCHSALRPGCGVAFAIDGDCEERLIIMYEVRNIGEGDRDAIAQRIRRSVAREHEISVQEVVLLKPGALLKTSSGKVQRSACRKAYLEGRLDVL